MGIATGSPVFGFLPILAFRNFVLKVPKPLNSTLSPFFKALVIESNRVSTILLISFCYKKEFLLVTFKINSDLVIKNYLFLV